MAGLSRTLWGLALIGTTLVACGSRSELYAFGAGGPGILPGGGDDASALDASPDALPGDEPPACVGMPIQLTVVEPNLYFVLDHSTSMKEMNKWPNVRQVVAQLISQIGAGARFGATMFPGGTSISSCQVGTEVMPLQQGDALGVVANKFLAATAADPSGGTPTAATLNKLAMTLSGLPGTTFAILATDGGPNCNASITCPVDQCTANIDGVSPQCPTDFSVDCCAPPTGTTESCLDDIAAVQAASNLAAAGVKTFVLGIPGSSPYGPVLDRLAIAGGTARTSEPLYYQVGTADTAALGASFAQIVAQTGAGCEFTLAAPPTGTVGLHVVLNGAIVPASGPDGWSLQGRTLTLFGTSCATVRSAGAPSLQFFDGCG
jgi:von Willebrand factor type A domain